MGPSWAPSGADDTNEQSGPSLDDRPGFGGTSETRRRDMIVSLVDGRPHKPYTIGELTVALSEWFEDETDGMVPTDEEIHSTLYDFDLPRLDAANRVVFERETGRVFSVDADETTRTSLTTGRTDDGTTPGQPAGDHGDTHGQTIEGSNVPAERVVELGVVLLGVAGVALAASTVSPFDPAYALVPATAVVLFFGYRTVTRR